MPLPPVEDAPNSMTRRHYLVERNRLRVKAYEPTRKEREEEELRLAKQREEQRRKMLDSWKTQSSFNNSSNYNNTMTDINYNNNNSGRPLPGGGPHSRRMKEAATLKNPNYYKIVKEEEAQRKAERVAAYKADMQQQLKDREAYLRRWRAEERAYDAALVESRRAQAKLQEQREKEEAMANKRYMDKMRESNLRELEQMREKTRAREAHELQVLRTVQEREKQKAATEERRARDIKKMMQKENEEYHRTVKKKQKEDKAREEAELKAMLEHNAALAARERMEQLQKREQFKTEFEETIQKQAEFRRTHNYEEPMETIRMRNEKAAASLALIKQEEKLREAERRQEYRDELMQQIREKYDWQLTHIDGV